MRVHLCTPYFRSKSDDRQSEFDECLKGNLENPFIERITLFIDDACEPPFRHEKMRIVEIPRRLTYRDWLEFALADPTPHISVLSNTDILFDETVAKLATVFSRNNRFVALSRHERIGGALERHPDPKWSQDVWAARNDGEFNELFRRAVDFPLGVPRCDNKIVYEAAVHGLDVINPFPSIRAIHLHESQVRGYHKTLDQTLVGGMGFVQPCANLMGQSKVELSIWPLKTKNITGVRMISALEEWSAGLDPAPADGQSTILAFNDEWQYPAITEKHAFDRMTQRRGAIPEDCVYFGFPWATLIDKLVNRPAEADGLLRQLDRLKSAVRHSARVVTVCQHIQMLRYQDILAGAGITDIFWSHKVVGQEHLPDQPNVRLHPFPLYPVQVCDNEEPYTDNHRRRFLFSFVGARARDFYLTQVRTYILEELSDYPSGHVVGRGDWHYNKIVYDHQILGNEKSVEGLVDGAASREFVETLKKSAFSLCPSGSGPNSIRLWESIAAGAIPVILADSLELPGPRALWEQAAVFCKEERAAVRALPARLKEIASDPELMCAKRRALRQLWMLYGPQTFVTDIEKFFAGGASDHSLDRERSLPMSDTDILSLAKEVFEKKGGRAEADFFLLLTASSRALLRPKAFLRLYNRYEIVKRAINQAVKNCDGGASADAWRHAWEKLKSIDDAGDRALSDPVLSIVTFGRNSNRSPLAYAPYRHMFENRIQFSEDKTFADLIVFSASKNIAECYQTPNAHDLLEKPLAVLSEEPLWDTTWGFEFDETQGVVRVDGREFEYAVLNHLTTDIFKFDKIPYFVTTEDHYAVRYANLFQRNAAMTPQEVLEVWRTAPIRQAYYAERRIDDRYDFERPELDLYGYCSYRTRLAEAAPDDGVVRVGQGWGSASRRQELPDWHLDKLAALDQRAFISSALENTHYPDYITEKPFDAFAALAVPVYAASMTHRIREIVPEGSFINVFGLEADEAAERLLAFEPDLDFAARYLEGQKRLAELFGNVETLRAERRRVVDATVRALDAVRRGEFSERRNYMSNKNIAYQA